MNIREAECKDALNIAAIGACVWVDTYGTEGVRNALSRFVSSEFSADKIKELITTRLVLVVEINNHLVGYAVFCHRKEELENLYVLPKFQGQGIGRGLINDLRARSQSINLSCWERNDSAIAFYKSCGFKESGETFFELDGENHRNVILVDAAQ